MQITLELTQFRELQHHLFGGENRLIEQAAFLLLKEAADTSLWVEDVEYLRNSDFVYQESWGLELTDESRSRVIKRAHESGRHLAEVHSHTFDSDAAFSASDFSGFTTFVPHILWRLKRAPYSAFVFSPRNFDSLFWNSRAEAPSGVAELLVNSEKYFPTGISLRKARSYEQSL